MMADSTIELTVYNKTPTTDEDQNSGTASEDMSYTAVVFPTDDGELPPKGPVFISNGTTDSKSIHINDNASPLNGDIPRKTEVVFANGKLKDDKNDKDMDEDKNDENDDSKAKKEDDDTDNKHTNGDNEHKTDKPEDKKNVERERNGENNTDKNKLDAEVLRSDDSAGKTNHSKSNDIENTTATEKTNGTSNDNGMTDSDTHAVSAILVSEQSKQMDEATRTVLTVGTARNMCEELEGLLTLLKKSLETGEDISENARKEICTRAKSVVGSLSQICNE